MAARGAAEAAVQHSVMDRVEQMSKLEAALQQEAVLGCGCRIREVLGCGCRIREGPSWLPY